jgi:hypothetical protein
MVNRIGFATGTLLLAFASTLWARAEFNLGSGPDAYAWERFAAEAWDHSKTAPDQDPIIGPDEGGEYVVIDADGNVLSTRPVTAVEEVGGANFLVEYNYRGPDLPSMEGNVLRARLVDPLVNLALFDNLFARGGSIYNGHNTVDLPTAGEVVTIDGDYETARRMVFPFNPVTDLPPDADHEYIGNQATAVIVNLGMELPINRVRFFPVLGQFDDALTIAAMEEPKPDPEDFGETSFAKNYLEWFEIGVAGNDAPIQEDQDWVFGLRPGQGKFRRYSETTGFIDSMYTDLNFTALVTTRESLDHVVDVRFPTQLARFVSLRPYIPERDWEVAEYEIYGEGYVRRSGYRTHILDFGESGVAWSKIRWKGEEPPGTQIQVRTRTGNTPSPDLFLDRQVNGRYLPVDFDTYRPKFLKICKHGPTHNGGGSHPCSPNAPDENTVRRSLDVDNWSFWSSMYDFNAGQRDPDSDSATWTDGTQILSPGPSRYLQLEVVLLATADQTPRLDELSLLFAETPAAAEVIGEVWPIEVDSFEPQSFTYVVKPILRTGNGGFDRLEIFTGGLVDLKDGIHSVRVGNEEIDIVDQFPPQKTETGDGIIISFDPLRDPRQDNEKRIEVEFSARVLRFGAEFSGWIYDSSEPDLKQSVKPGNATIRFVGDVLSVRTPTGGELLQRLEIQPRVFTPNGDQVNEEVAISFDLRDLTDARPVDVQVFALNGRLVRRSLPECGLAGDVIARRGSGHFSHCWNGSDDAAGSLAPPGAYLIQVELDSDEGRKTATGTVSVAY